MKMEMPAFSGKWILGVTILIYLIIFNETCGPVAVFSIIFASVYGILSALCKSGVKHLQIPYIRASSKFDFLCIFMSVWMDALAILCACAILARTLSTCLDIMTGGLARILILGRNSSPNEPWPDVLGVTIVCLMSGMFMLGLENNKVFTVLMFFGMIGITGTVTTISLMDGNTTEWSKDYLVSNGISSFLTGAALSTFMIPNEVPSRLNKQGCRKFLEIILILLCAVLTVSCLSMIVPFKTDKDYLAVPLFKIIESNGYPKLVQAIACLLLLCSSGSFLELFPELYNIIVRLATSEWKILAKQISYENPDSGNPVLATFIGGSLCAMLAFACPMKNLTYILAASHLCAGLSRAFYLLYFPFRPKYMEQSCESNLSYRRLSTTIPKETVSRKRTLWNIKVPNTIKKPNYINKVKSKKEVEKEWLLLGEPSSPSTVHCEKHIASSTLTDEDESEFECTEKFENSDSDVSTDIDAIVDEYRQKVKITTAGPMENTIRVPSTASWRIAIFAIVVIFFGINLSLLGILLELAPAYITGLIGTFLISTMMCFIPKYSSNYINVGPILCSACITLGSILLSACLNQSWPAIIFWILAGLALIIRCDNWCCSCLDQPLPIQMKPDISAEQITNLRIPQPPKGAIIPGQIQRQR